MLIAEAVLGCSMGCGILCALVGLVHVLELLGTMLRCRGAGARRHAREVLRFTAGRGRWG